MGKDRTFHSVILAGVHDVKTLKMKIRPDEEHKYNSPWNIASDFDVNMSFPKEEIITMLDDYVENKGVDLYKDNSIGEVKETYVDIDNKSKKIVEVYC